MAFFLFIYRCGRAEAAEENERNAVVTKLAEFKNKWMKDPEFRRGYEDASEELAREIYVTAIGKRVIFVKKSQKTPKTALNIARERMKEAQS